MSLYYYDADGNKQTNLITLDTEDFIISNNDLYYTKFKTISQYINSSCYLYKNNITQTCTIDFKGYKINSNITNGLLNFSLPYDYTPKDNVSFCGILLNQNSNFVSGETKMALARIKLQPATSSDSNGKIYIEWYAKAMDTTATINSNLGLWRNDLTVSSTIPAWYLYGGTSYFTVK